MKNLIKATLKAKSISGGDMGREGVDRRRFLAGTGAATVAIASAATAGTEAADRPAAEPAAPQAAGKPEGYMFLKPAEAYFVEAAVDHMIPEDEMSPSGTALGVATFIDRALAGSWGKGDRLYMQGPWLRGTPNQGYQLPLTPAELYRTAIRACDIYCRKTFRNVFAACDAADKELFLKDLSGGKLTLEGLPGRTFFAMFYANVMEGMFSDPIYGGNKDKAAWKMIGFPGVIANNSENVKLYNDGRRFVADPVSIADMS
jgi:gluconate 2-dehydrogenase gamma chain